MGTPSLLYSADYSSPYLLGRSTTASPLSRRKVPRQRVPPALPQTDKQTFEVCTSITSHSISYTATILVPVALRIFETPKGSQQQAWDANSSWGGTSKCSSLLQVLLKPGWRGRGFGADQVGDQEWHDKEHHGNCA